MRWVCTPPQRTQCLVGHTRLSWGSTTPLHTWPSSLSAELSIFSLSGHSLKLTHLHQQTTLSSFVHLQCILLFPADKEQKAPFSPCTPLSPLPRGNPSPFPRQSPALEGVSQLCPQEAVLTRGHWWTEGAVAEGTRRDDSRAHQSSSSTSLLSPPGSWCCWQFHWAEKGGSELLKWDSSEWWGNFLGPKSSQIRSPSHYSHLCAGGSEEDLNWSSVQLWSDSHDCAFHSQTTWASSPHSSQLPAWARVEEHSVSFPSCFNTGCLEHCRTLPRRGGEGGEGLHRQLQVKNQQLLPCFCYKQRKKTLQATWPNTAPKPAQQNGCFHT